MTPHTERERIRVLEGFYKKARKTVEFEPAIRFSGVEVHRRVACALCDMLQAEAPCVERDEVILYRRTVINTPELFTEKEWSDISSKHFLHEKGRVCNVCPDYEKMLKTGLAKTKIELEARIEQAVGEQREYYISQHMTVCAVMGLAERYCQAARRVGNWQAAKDLEQVPAKAPQTFRQALQFLRVLHFTLWCEGEYHNGLGRLDQYLYPYLQKDMDKGELTEDQALELVEEFFLALNRDSDLYPGIQQGDNGQSLMLGGIRPDGTDGFNLLSRLCLRASRELKLIDPKINLRVSAETPIEIYEEGTTLTKEGLGFPQYSNDDVVIPGLMAKGYTQKDARNYTVAACWEFIVPGEGMDIPNIAAVNFPAIVNCCMEKNLDRCGDFDVFYTCLEQMLQDECARLLKQCSNIYLVSAPFLTLLMHSKEQGKDISEGGKYNNYGFHGVGISTAVDSLYALKHLVFSTKEISPDMAKTVIRGDCSDAELLAQLRYEIPRMGDGDEAVDSLAAKLLNSFANAVEPLRNERGGCVRAGTGSAMFYLWHAEEIKGTLSGFRAGEAFGANYAPELFARSKGPLSVIWSFTRPDLKRTINGGPLTMEFDATLFKEPSGIHKIALLVRRFIQLGGHQMQLNSVDRAQMQDAQIHPEAHRQLIVRVWGWSAYFVELDKEYQDHIISRQEFRV